MAETYTDRDGDIWRRKGDGIDHPFGDSGTWVEVRDGQVGRNDGHHWFLFDTHDPAIEQALAAWAALMPPKEPERPKTFRDSNDYEWSYVDDDTVRFYDGSLARRSDLSWSYLGTQPRVPLNGALETAKEAFAALLPPTKPTALAPAIHWSFRATMLSYDGPRVRREVDAAGGDPESIRVQPTRTNRTYKGQPLWRFAVTAELLKP